MSDRMMHVRESELRALLRDTAADISFATQSKDSCHDRVVRARDSAAAALASLPNRVASVCSTCEGCGHGPCSAHACMTRYGDDERHRLRGVRCEHMRPCADCDNGVAYTAAT